MKTAASQPDSYSTQLDSIRSVIVSHSSATHQIWNRALANNSYSHQNAILELVSGDKTLCWWLVLEKLHMEQLWILRQATGQPAASFRTAAGAC